MRVFDLKEPWATHRKYEVFEDRHTDIFARPEVTADRIVLCQAMVEAISDNLSSISNQLLAKYVLTRYMLLYFVREILDSGNMASEIAENPSQFVRMSPDRVHFKKCISRIVADLIVDLNAEVKEFGDDFDYRGRLRDSDWVKALGRKVVADHVKLVNRDRLPSFKTEWEAKNA